MKRVRERLSVTKYERTALAMAVPSTVLVL